MARYRKVDPRIWNDAKFRDLSDNAKLAFFMLLTHPNMTALGAMRATVSGLAEEMGWEPEAFREALQEALSKGMAEHDPKACLIALPQFIKYNPPESPNVVKAWSGALDLLPECELKTRVIAGAKDFAEAKGEGFAEAFAKSMPKGIANQEQEQEQKQDTSSGSAGEGKKTGKQSRKKPSTPIPDDFTPNESCKAKALELGVSLNTELPKFIDHALANDRRQVDWQAAFRTWLGNANQFSGGRPPVTEPPRRGGFKLD
jgi:hypothetical protein